MDTAEINKIRDQHSRQHWPKFLNSVEIKGLRGWHGEVVRFQFPVVAIVGENGSGKSTLLKCAACAYKATGERTFYPSDFFITTHWDTVADTRITYEIRQGASFLNFDTKKGAHRWKFSKTQPKRDVFWFDISRTLPLDAAAGYAYLAQRAAAEVSSLDLKDEYRKDLSHVLGRAYTGARFAKSDLDAKREVGLLSRDFGEISQYHQGAGEDATLDLFRALQNIPDTSLLIIDEVEASLHPRAQRRLVRFLLHFAREKKIQVILSTHSPFVLQELPSEARILLLNQGGAINLIYGATVEMALTGMDDEKHSELYAFVEDQEAEILTREIIAATSRGHEILQRVGIVPVGASNEVIALGRLGSKLPYNSIAILDGDAPNPNCLNLPGAASPEEVVFGELKARHWSNLDQRFGVGAGSLFSYLDLAILEPDHHKWTTIVGDQISVSKRSVWEILCKEWVRVCLAPSDRDTFVNGIASKLPIVAPFSED